mgnify:FL=1
MKFVSSFEKFWVFTAFILIFSTNIKAQEWHYEISCAGIGAKGSSLVEVTSFGKTVDAALAQMRKDAVHGVLFKGMGGNCMQKPLAMKAELETEHESFFSKFFSSSGEYDKYVEDDVNTAVSVAKVGKKQYKVTKVLSVKKDLLRKDLEKAGILKPLGY